MGNLEMLDSADSGEDCTGMRKLDYSRLSLAQFFYSRLELLYFVLQLLSCHDLSKAHWRGIARVSYPQKI